MFKGVNQPLEKVEPNPKSIFDPLNLWKRF